MNVVTATLSNVTIKEVKTFKYGYISLFINVHLYTHIYILCLNKYKYLVNSECQLFQTESIARYLTIKCTTCMYRIKLMVTLQHDFRMQYS